MVKQLNS